MMSLRLLRELRCLLLKRRRVVVVLFFECDFGGLFFLSFVDLFFFLFSFTPSSLLSISRPPYDIYIIHDDLTSTTRHSFWSFYFYFSTYPGPYIRSKKHTLPRFYRPSKRPKPIRHTNCAKWKKSDQIISSIITPLPLPPQKRQKEQKTTTADTSWKTKSTNMARCYIQLRRKNLNRGGKKEG